MTFSPNLHVFFYMVWVFIRIIIVSEIIHLSRMASFYLISAATLFSNKITFWGIRVRTSTYLSGRHNSTHNWGYSHPCLEYNLKFVNKERLLLQWCKDNEVLFMVTCPFWDKHLDNKYHVYKLIVQISAFNFQLILTLLLSSIWKASFWWKRTGS